MKRQLLYILAPALLTAAGCSESTTAVGEEDGYGTLRVACTPDDKPGVHAAATPGTDDFTLELVQGDETRKWASVTAFNTEKPLLLMGVYTATVTSGDSETEGFGCACYTGSQQFELKPRVQNSVQIPAKLVNSLALVRTTEQFRAYFHDVVFTVATGTGNDFDFHFSSTASPVVPDTEEPVYVRVGTALKVTGTAHRQSATGEDNGPEVTFPEQSVAATKPATRHIFEFDAANAGTATLRLLLDEEVVETVTFPVELNEDAIL